jgi:hypothetical protein
MANILQANGAQPQKPTKFVSLFTSRFMSGLFTNRSLLRGPLSFIYSDYYHAGATDALCDGLNSEVSIRQTMIRRPGNPVWCSVQTTEAIDSFYSFHQSNGTISVIADGTAHVYVATPTSLTSIFTKSAAAGEATFQGIDTTLYIADGVDTVKYIPGTTNPQTGKPMWNWGGAAPTVAPTLAVTPTGTSGIAWVASTMWTTMGMLFDANGNIQQLTSVNASGTNTTQLGTTGNGAPAFVSGPGTTVTETSGTPIVWSNRGLIGSWSSGASYYNASTTPAGATLNLSCIIYDPITKACYMQINGGAGVVRTSGNTRPNFRAVVGWNQDGDGNCKWFYLGGIGVPGLWQPSHTYQLLGSVSNDDSNSGIVTPTTVSQAGIGTANGTPLFWWIATNTGTSGTSGSYIPTWATTPGFPTNDGTNMIWNCVCNGTWLANTNYFPWSSTATSFGAIKDPNGNIQICITANGPSAPTIPATWATTYGNTTLDGVGSGNSFVGVTWACVGSSLSWAPNTQWYLPTGGFVPPQASQAYGGATLSQAGINEYVINSGKSQTPGPPAWGALHTNTTDGTVTWYSASAFTAAGFSFTTGYGWCYAYKARKLSDSSVLTAPPLQIPGTNSPNITGPLGPPTGCGDGTVTSASPVAQIVGGNTGAQILITMVGSTDPQFDTISVYRSTDGFGAGGPYLFLTDIPMPPMRGALPGIAQIIDFMPDKATALLPGLDPLEEAPVDNVNDPPPGQFGSTQFVSSGANTPTIPLAGTAIQGQVYHQGRLWAFVGNTVFASGGPDTNPGNGFTAWPPINEFPFDSPIVRLLPTANSLIVFTTTDVYLIGGGPAIADYYSQLLVGGVGLLSYNAVTVMLGLPYLFTSDRQYITIDPSGGFTRIGHPIGDKLTQYNPTAVYTTYHSYGDLEHALFLTDGSSEWYRCDPNPTPDSQMTGPIWSPRATIAGGFKAVQSIVVSPGTTKLLIGPAGAGNILARDSTFTNFQDNGSAYSSFFVAGNIVLAQAGQMAQLDFIEADFVQVGTQATVSVMFDELSPTNGASFEKISNEFVSDPPKLFGPTGIPKTMWMNRYFFGQTTPGNGGTQEPIPAWCKSLQLKVDFGNTDTIQNELLAFTIFGALYQEK